MIAIIAALREELSALLDATLEGGSVRTERVAGCDLHRGRLAGHDVVLAQSGIGKVAAAATAAVLTERAGSVLMLGTAGGLGDQVDPGDVVVATELLQHDFDARPAWERWVSPSLGIARIPTDPYLTAALAASATAVCARHRPDLAELGLAAPKVHRGLIISGDLFVADETSERLLRELPDALAVEMEGAAVAQVCRAAGVPFAVCRTISDRADSSAMVDFTSFLRLVAAPYAHDLAVGALKLLS